MNLSFGLALSLHLLPGEWNEIHPQVRLDGDWWAVGAYLNSEDRLSVSAGLTWQDGPWWAEAGLVTGYSGADVLPFVRAGYDFGDVRIFVAPAATVKRDIGVVIGAEFMIGR